MRKTRISRGVRQAVTAICFFLALPAAGGQAADESVGFSILKFGGGIVSAFMIHEAAHELVALATGTEMSWRAGDINQPLTFTEKSTNRGAGFLISSAGLITQAAGAEIILQYDGIDKNDSFVRGMMFWNILNPITYVIDYWFLQRTNSASNGCYQGDLRGVQQYTDRATADVFSVTLLAVAAFQGYRYARTQSWAPEWLKAKELENVGLAPLPSGGALLSYTCEF